MATLTAEAGPVGYGNGARTHSRACQPALGMALADAFKSNTIVAITKFKLLAMARAVAERLEVIICSNGSAFKAGAGGGPYIYLWGVYRRQAQPAHGAGRRA